MPALGDFLGQLRENQPQGKYGLAFERLMVNYFRTDPVLSDEYEDVTRWDRWPFNSGRADTDIDSVDLRRLALSTTPTTGQTNRATPATSLTSSLKSPEAPSKPSASSTD